MTQLILQQKIDEYAKIDSEMYCLNDTLHKKIFEAGFQFGTRFVLNEIETLMVEFAEWAYKNYDYIERIGNKNEWVWKKNNDVFTTKQLLEEFINEKANKDE